MRIYKTGERCPCCGQPIKLTEPEALYVYSQLINALGLSEDPNEQEEQENEQNAY